LKGQKQQQFKKQLSIQLYKYKALLLFSQQQNCLSSLFQLLQIQDATTAVAQNRTLSPQSTTKKAPSTDMTTASFKILRIILSKI